MPRVIIDLKVRKAELQTELIFGANADPVARLKKGEIDAMLAAIPASEPDIESVALFEVRHLLAGNLLTLASGGRIAHHTPKN